MQALERFLEWGGLKKDIACLVLSGISLVISIFHLLPLPFDAAWVAIILCGVPILLEAFIGLVTAFDIKADVLVSIALIASVLIGEDFAAGEIAFIMQLGALLEDLTVAKARAGIEKLVHLTPPDRPQACRRPGGNHPRRTGLRGRPAPRPPRGNHPGGREDRLRRNVDQPGGHDRGVPARGQTSR